MRWMNLYVTCTFDLSHASILTACAPGRKIHEYLHVRARSKKLYCTLTCVFRNTSS
jgi:hypothetical protein